MLRKIKRSNDNPKILILEDDPDQMDLLIDFALSEIRDLRQDESTNDKQSQKLDSIQIIKINNYDSLRKAVVMHKGVLLALLDCNTPDIKGGASHDQLVKTSRGITGQHKSVDVVAKHLPDTAITLISSMDRFQFIVHKYYERKHNLSIKFVRKNDPLRIKRNIRFYLNEYLGSLD